MPKDVASTATSASLGTLMDASPDLIYFKDAAGVYQYINKAFCEVFGLPAEAVLGHTDFEIFPEENADRHHKTDLVVLNEAAPFGSFEYEVNHGGQSVWLQVLKAPVRDEYGRVRGIFCTARNITLDKQQENQARRVRQELERDVASQAEQLRQTNLELRQQILERRHAEKALEESLRTVNLIVEQSPIGIAFVSNRIVHRANPHFHALFGRTLGTIPGLPTASFYPDATAYEAFGQEFYPVLGRGESVDTVRIMRRADGTDFWCRIIGQALFPDRPQEGSIWLMEDVTERRMAEEATLAAERLKREFMDNMSHEIRTPLNGILGMAELLMASGVSEDQQALVATLQESARNLTELLESILDFSRMDSSGKEKHNDPFSLDNIIQGAVNSFGSAALQKGVSLTCRISPDAPDTVVGDGAGLRRVLAALLSNAVKFTEKGNVEVSVTSGPDCHHTVPSRPSASEVLLSFTVRDTGVGLAADQLQAIFEPFRQADGSMTRRFGGAGLGLAIARKVADTMGGSLTVESQLGKGSAFCFSAPFTLPGGDGGGTFS